jgi:hypothetical protein
MNPNQIGSLSIYKIGNSISTGKITNS